MLGWNQRPLPCQGVDQLDLAALSEFVTLIECGDTGSPDDVDTPENLARVRREATVRSKENF